MSALTLHQYRPGVERDVIDLHDEYYAQHWGFDARFRAQVEREFFEFIQEFKPGKDGFWWAANTDFVGSIAVDGSRSSEGQARLRWFIVSETSQGTGVGGALLDLALQFSRDAGFQTVYLWTFEGLSAARKLYERNGFRLAETAVGNGWGPEIIEQRFVLDL